MLLLYYGIERRYICLLKWNVDIDSECKYIKRGQHRIRISDFLQKCLKDLKQTGPEEAVYVFGNSRTKYMRPLPESGINDILSKLADIDKSDEYYKALSPANIRKILFKYLLQQQWPMQNILLHMSIPITNIGNYVTDEQIWGYKAENENKEMELDEILKEVL